MSSNFGQRTTDDWLKEGHRFLSIENEQEAIRCFNEAIRINPTYITFGASL